MNMNREINFRACYDNRMWFVAKFDLWGDPDQRTCDLAPISPKYEELYNILLNEVELMQYTGLKDKNGVEIYEGDIIEAGFLMDGLLLTDSGVVVFKEYRFIVEQPDYGDEDLVDWTLGESLEVIGNIYEKSELLKEDRR